MFGHDDNDEPVNTADDQSQSTTTSSVDPATEQSSAADDATMANQGADMVSSDGQTNAPILSSGYVDADATPAVNDTPVVRPSSSVSADDSTTHSTTTDDLLSIKQQALQHLSPLVSQLDQSPEEKFRTTMMMIQASDNQALVQTAYEAAQNIIDEKIRAQALLDIVNEINYFTQQKQ